MVSTAECRDWKASDILGTGKVPWFVRKRLAPCSTCKESGSPMHRKAEVRRVLWRSPSTSLHSRREGAWVYFCLDARFCNFLCWNFMRFLLPSFSTSSWMAKYPFEAWGTPPSFVWFPLHQLINIENTTLENTTNDWLVTRHCATDHHPLGPVQCTSLAVYLAHTSLASYRKQFSKPYGSHGKQCPHAVSVHCFSLIHKASHFTI